jgi:ribosomal protein S4
MSNVRYKPRYKKGILRKTKFFLVAKDLKKLKKKKWGFFLRTFVSAAFQEPLIRNDLRLISNRTISLRKEHTRLFFFRRQVSSFFSAFRGSALRKIFLKSPGVSFLDFVELRLDMILLRSCLVKTPYQARWLVASGFVFVNGNVVRVISYNLHVGDCVQIKKSISMDRFFTLYTFALPSEYLEISYEIFSVIIVSTPSNQIRKEVAKLYYFFLGVEEIASFNRFC